MSEAESKAVAGTILRPVFKSVLAICALDRSISEMDIEHLTIALCEQVHLAQSGDLGRVEEMLVAQAHTLDGLFSHLVKRSEINVDNDFSIMEGLMKLGLRAQSQCRATLATLADITKPDSISLKNTVHGDQELNIYSPDNNAEPAPNQKPRNEVLEKTEHESDKWLDRRAPQAAIGVNSDLETVAEIDRSDVA